MSLNVPLSVVLRNSRVERNITAEIGNLRMRSVIPRGFASIDVSFSRPLRFRPSEVDYYTAVLVYDNRNGQVAWEGRLEDPERHAGASGEIWGLTAIGPAAHASDRTVPIIYVDRRIDAWGRVDLTGNTPRGDATSGDSSTGDANPVLRLAWNGGQGLVTGDRLAVQYLPCRQTGQFIARVGCDHIEGVASATLKVEVFGRVGGFPGADASLEQDSWSTSPASILQRYGNEHSVKYTAVDLRLFLSSGTATSGGNYWSNVTNLHIVGSRKLADGTDKTSGYTTASVLASEVVADLLGRVLNKFDGDNALIATSSFAIEQLAYPDGVASDQVLDDLMLLEPDMFWAAWESNASGLYRFEWSTWPTSVDYEATVWDGFDSPASAVDLYDSVTVRYKGAHGAIRHSVRTQTVDVLADAGLTRTAFIDLGDEGGGATNAAQVGDVFLSDHQYPPNKGTLTVARPIVSRSEGRMVQPWEIRPGRLIAVQDIEPVVDALNATTRDGVTVFRVVSVDYDADSNSAQLELDSYARSTAQALAALQNNPALVRRRR